MARTPPNPKTSRARSPNARPSWGGELTWYSFLLSARAVHGGLEFFEEPREISLLIMRVQTAGIWQDPEHSAPLQKYRVGIAEPVPLHPLFDAL